MKRIRYFDLLRCISFCFIIFYHMISQLYFSRLFTLDKVLPFYENDNMNIAIDRKSTRLNSSHVR